MDSSQKVVGVGAAGEPSEGQERMQKEKGEGGAVGEGVVGGESRSNDIN